MSVVEYKLQNKHLFLLQFEEEHIILFKVLTLGEFDTYRSILTKYPHMYDKIMDDIFGKCVIEYLWGTYFYTYKDYEESFDDLIEVIPSGVVETVALLIIRLSGASNSEILIDDLEHAKNEIVLDSQKMLYILMSRLYGNSNFDYDNMYYVDYLHYLAVFELIELGYTPEFPLRLEPQQHQKTEYIDFEKENKLFYKEFKNNKQ